LVVNTRKFHRAHTNSTNAGQGHESTAPNWQPDLRSTGVHSPVAGLKLRGDRLTSRSVEPLAEVGRGVRGAPRIGEEVRAGGREHFRRGHHVLGGPARDTPGP
jgi:hypothetical protein